MDYAIVGALAGIFTTFSTVPQIYRVLKLKSAREISLLFTVLLATGVSLWTLYGILNRAWPIILWNAISLGLIFTLILAKLRYSAP